MRVSRWSAAIACSLFVACVGPTDLNQVTPPLSMSVVSGDGQQGPPGSQLPDPLVVRVEDARGRPVAGQIVNFRVVSGGGSVFAGAAISNRSGLAQERWTLGFGGLQRVEARAIDPATGEPLTFAVFTATLTDSIPPVTFNVNAFPNPAPLGDSVIVTAVVSDSFTGGSNIAGADVQVDSGPFLAMSAGDGAFDQQNEFVIRTLVGLGLGGHLVCVRGRDSAGNIGFPDCTFLLVTNGGGGGDSTPPITSNVNASPNPAHPTDSVVITALVSDSLTGQSTIAGAEVLLDSVLLMAMLPQDGGFDQQVEGVTRTFAGLALGGHLACVRGRDSAGNVGSFSCTFFTVTNGGGGGDTLGPVTLNVTATPDSASPTDSILIRAEVRDTFTGGSNIASAEMRVDSGGFVPMFPTDGAFDQQNERVNRLVVGLAAGSHTVCVRGSDTAGNIGNETCIGFSVAAAIRELPRTARRQR
jgi:hypothetical protein